MKNIFVLIFIVAFWGYAAVQSDNSEYICTQSRCIRITHTQEKTKRRENENLSITYLLYGEIPPAPSVAHEARLKMSKEHEEIMEKRNSIWYKLYQTFFEW